jgi:PAS domain S-box-containing protein
MANEEIFLRERKAFRLIAEAALHPRGSPELYHRVLTGIIETLEFDIGTLRLLDNQEDVLRLEATVGIPEGEVQDAVPLDDPEYLAARVARTKTPIFESDVSKSTELKSRMKVIEALRVQSLIFWPIVGARDELLGVMNVANRTVKPLSEEDKDFFQIVAGMFAAVIERHRAMDALRESEERYRRLAESVVDIIWTVDMNLQFTYASPSIEEVLGYTPQEALSMPLDDMIPSESLKLIEDTLAESLRLEATVGKDGYESPPLEIQMLHKDGTVLWIEISRTFLRDDDDTPIGVLGVARDVTRRKTVEKELARAKAQAEFYNDLMAHDLANMQQGILVSLELMLRDSELPKELRGLANRALAQTKRGVTLTGNVKKLGRLVGGEKELSKTDLHQSVMDAIGIVVDSYPDKEIKVNTNLVKGKQKVLADEFLIDLFYNLLHNAARMDQSESVVIDVSEYPSDEEGMLMLKIEDRGPGISDTMKEAILTRFDEKVKRGWGLGLTLVKQIVDRYGGRIWIEDRVAGDHGQGASFVLVLPAAA